MKVVVNSSPLIALSLLGKLDLLSQIFDEVFVPQSVYQEVVSEGKGLPGCEEVEAAKWIVVKEVKEKPVIELLLLGMDRAELDVLLLAREIGAEWVIMDEKLGRRVAKQQGLNVKGTIGVLLTSYFAGLVSEKEAEEAVDKLRESAVRISDDLIHWFKTQLRNR